MCADLVCWDDTIATLKEHAASWENQTLNESVLCMVKGARASRKGMEPGLGAQRRPPPGRVIRMRVEGGIGSAQLNRRGQNSQAKERTHGRPRFKVLATRN